MTATKREACFVCDRRTTLRHEQRSVACCHECQKSPLDLVTYTDVRGVTRPYDSGNDWKACDDKV